MSGAPFRFISSDRRVRDPKDLQARLHIPVVAAIPDLASVKVPALV